MMQHFLAFLLGMAPRAEYWIATLILIGVMIALSVMKPKKNSQTRAILIKIFYGAGMVISFIFLVYLSWDQWVISNYLEVAVFLTIGWFLAISPSVKSPKQKNTSRAHRIIVKIIWALLSAGSLVLFIFLLTIEGEELSPIVGAFSILSLLAAIFFAAPLLGGGKYTYTGPSSYKSRSWGGGGGGGFSGHTGGSSGGGGGGAKW